MYLGHFFMLFVAIIRGCFLYDKENISIFFSIYFKKSPYIGVQRQKENREFRCSFFQTEKTQRIGIKYSKYFYIGNLLQHRETFGN